MLQLEITAVTSPLKHQFSISRGSKLTAETVRVQLTHGDHIGRGECVPYGRYGETVAQVIRDIESQRDRIEAGLSRDGLQTCLPAGAARCALDVAFWDLEAKQTGLPVWKRAGLPAPRPLSCTMSLSLDAPDTMANAAKRTEAKILKLKLGGDEDMARIVAVHEARPDAKLVVDGNEGLVPSDFRRLAEMAAAHGVIMIEQPFGQEDEDKLSSMECPVAICADESVHTAADIQRLARLYDMVNIKLDKAGGLTEALLMLEEARRCRLGVMIGCMVASSLSMAPAALLGAATDLTDLDGPLWLAEDVPHGLHYEDGLLSPPLPTLWG